MEQRKEALELCLEMARLADAAMISDVGSRALMAHAAARLAAYNVRVNLPSIEDEGFREEMAALVEEQLR